MRNAPEREFITLCTNAASRLARHDSAVVLGVCLCLAPFPPVNLAGLLLTGLNFVLVWNNRLPKSEIPLLRAGIFVILVYAVLWTAVIFWAVHTGTFSGVAGWLNDWRLWLWDGLHPPTPSVSHSIQRI
jgi:hypothetical protein